MTDARVMSGTWGQVWVGGEPWVELESFQAKYTKNKSDISLCGEMVTGYKVTSVKGSGSITAHKVYTRNTEQIDAILQGKDVRCTIVAALNDPDAYGAERVALYDVSFDDETLMDFAAGNTSKVTYPFTFGRREWLDKVEAR